MGARKSLSALGLAAGASIAVWGGVDVINNSSAEAANQPASTVAEGNQGLTEWAPAGARMVGGAALALLSLGGLAGSGRPGRDEAPVQTLTLQFHEY